jgi:hypothetical protein
LLKHGNKDKKMRTKTILLTAAVSAASIIAAVAQTVYSVNAVGYVNVTVRAGKFALLANPLALPTNSLAAVLPDAPANTIVYEFNAASATYSIYTKRASGAWTGTGADTARLDPGEGFFVKNAGTTDMTITFVGEVVQGTDITVDLPAGFSLVASKVPQAGKVEAELGLVASNGDLIYQFSSATSTYALSTRRTATWTPAEPIIGVGEGFFFKATAAKQWKRTFNVNQ